MKKKYSLKRNEEIATIIHNRQFMKNYSYVIYFLKKETNEHARICISVSKKNGNAVVRNKIKRQIREMITDIFDFTQKCDYVVIVRNGYLENDFKLNKENLKKLYLKINSNKGEKINEEK